MAEIADVPQRVADWIVAHAATSAIFNAANVMVVDDDQAPDDAIHSNVALVSLRNTGRAVDQLNRGTIRIVSLSRRLVDRPGTVGEGKYNAADASAQNLQSIILALANGYAGGAVDEQFVIDSNTLVDTAKAEGAHWRTSVDFAFGCVAAYGLQGTQADGTTPDRGA